MPRIDRRVMAPTLALVLAALSASAQTTSDPIAVAVAAAATGAHAADPPAALTFANRRIVVLRATIALRSPAVRAAAATEQIGRLLEETPDAPLTAERYDHGVVLKVRNHPVVVVFAADADALDGETMQGKADAALSNLTVAAREAGELRRPARLARAAGLALAATIVYGLALWCLVRVDVTIASSLADATERGLKHVPGGEVMIMARMPRLVHWVLTLIGLGCGLFLTYTWLAFVFRQFPYTRPWGESLRARLWSALGAAGHAAVTQIPRLLTIVGIVLITRLAVRVVNGAFSAVEQGHVSLPGVYPETVQLTRRLVTVLLWLFALVVSYEYIPGSHSDAFRGISVFVGLVVSLSSSGVVNQMMGGMMITYSRALRVGDFVKLGDIEGMVTHLGMLSTKLRNVRNEEITIPNTVVASSPAVNFSRHAETDGVFTPASVTVGYDTPWRQVQALLLLAAERTASVRRQPKAFVLQTALSDFSVHYTLLVCVESPNRRLATLNVLHANILDAFNEFGVQIMTPNYEADPEGRKVVPPSQWHAAPAPEGDHGEQRRQAQSAASSALTRQHAEPTSSRTPPML